MADKVENKLVGIETLKSFTSPEELEVWELLVKVHDKFVKLPDKHPCVMSEWTFHMHGLQSVMEHRICKRIAPEIFR